MTKVVLTANQDTEVDFSEMEKRMLETLKGEQKTFMEKYFKENHEYQKQSSNGKGVVESFMGEDGAEKRKRVVEEFRKGEYCNPNVIREQWTVTIPNIAVHERATHLRDMVWVTDVVKGKAGETVNYFSLIWS